MKVSSKTRYALHTVLDLALHRNTGVVRVSDISRRQDIPQKFLEQILLALKSGGIVSSKRGAKGGYYLNKAPAEITVASIVQVTEKALLSEEAARGVNNSRSPFDGIWKNLNDYVTTILEDTTIDDICRQAEQMSKVLEYSI